MLSACFVICTRHLAAISVVALACVSTAGALPAQRPTPVRSRFDLELVPTPGTTSAELIAVLPATIEGRQKVLKLAYTPEPTRMMEEGGNTYAVFAMPSPARTFEVAVVADMLLSPPQGKPLKQPKESSLSPDGKKIDPFAQWLVAEKFIDADAPAIVGAAQKLKGKTDEDLAHNAAKLVMGQLAYAGFDMKSRGALVAWESSKGDCTEFSDLLVSLCRARGIPARHCSGYTTEWEVVPFHSWVEVYCKGKGWILFDPSLGKGRVEALNGPKPIYVHLSAVRNDAVIQGGQMYGYTFVGAEVKVTSRLTVTVDGKTRTWPAK